LAKANTILLIITKERKKQTNSFSVSDRQEKNKKIMERNASSRALLSKIKGHQNYEIQFTFQ
jgi:hypothetical protein